MYAALRLRNMSIINRYDLKTEINSVKLYKVPLTGGRTILPVSNKYWQFVIFDHVFNKAFFENP